MEVRGRNRKWFGTGSWGAIGKVRVVVVFEFSSRVGEHGKHVSIGSEDGDWSRRGSVDRKEGAIRGELAADFFFLNVEETSNVFYHLFVGKSHL